MILSIIRKRLLVKIVVIIEVVNVALKVVYAFSKGFSIFLYGIKYLLMTFKCFFNSWKCQFGRIFFQIRLFDVSSLPLQQDDDWTGWRHPAGTTLRKVEERNVLKILGRHAQSCRNVLLRSSCKRLSSYFVFWKSLTLTKITLSTSTNLRLI
jgi:hypothetical protein